MARRREREREDGAELEPALEAVGRRKSGGVAERSLVLERRVVDQASDDPVFVPDLGQAALASASIDASERCTN
jgi:hypothetical protein